MTVNQQTVEETKAQIRVWSTKSLQLAKSGATPDEFYSGLLTRIITALAAAERQYGYWTRMASSDCSQVNAEQNLPNQENEDGVKHHRLIERVARRAIILAPPFSGTTDGEGESNPTRYLLVLGSLQHDERQDGLIEVFQRPDTAPDTQGYLRFVQQMCDLAAECLVVKLCVPSVIDKRSGNKPMLSPALPTNHSI